jgi:hypothetical protein
VEFSFMRTSPEQPDVGNSKLHPRTNNQAHRLKWPEDRKRIILSSSRERRNNPGASGLP